MANPSPSPHVRRRRSTTEDRRQDLEREDRRKSLVAAHLGPPSRLPVARPFPVDFPRKQPRGELPLSPLFLPVETASKTELGAQRSARSGEPRREPRRLCLFFIVFAIWSPALFTYLTRSPASLALHISPCGFNE